VGIDLPDLSLYFIASHRTTERLNILTIYTFKAIYKHTPTQDRSKRMSKH